MSAPPSVPPPAADPADGFHFLSAGELRSRVEAWHMARLRDDEHRLHDRDDAHRALVKTLREGRLSTADIERGLAQATLAAERGQTELLILRFPNELCRDGGRAINNDEPDWEESLDGIPRQLHELWHAHLRPLGYRLTARILEFPGGLPGDVGLFLHWD